MTAPKAGVLCSLTRRRGDRPPPPLSGNEPGPPNARPRPRLPSTPAEVPPPLAAFAPRSPGQGAEHGPPAPLTSPRNRRQQGPERQRTRPGAAAAGEERGAAPGAPHGTTGPPLPAPGITRRPHCASAVRTPFRSGPAGHAGYCSPRPQRRGPAGGRRRRAAMRRGGAAASAAHAHAAALGGRAAKRPPSWFSASGFASLLVVSEVKLLSAAWPLQTSSFSRSLAKACSKSAATNQSGLGGVLGQWWKRAIWSVVLWHVCARCRCLLRAKVNGQS